MNPASQYQNYIVIIPILISLAALFISIRNVGYAKINIFHSIQKLVLQKAIDCNNVYAVEVEKFSNKSGDVRFFDNMPFLIEIVASKILIADSLTKFKQKKHQDFFLTQFWIQVNPSIRQYLQEYKKPIGMDSEEIMLTMQAKKSLESAMSAIGRKR